MSKLIDEYEALGGFDSPSFLDEKALRLELKARSIASRIGYQVDESEAIANDVILGLNDADSIITQKLREREA